MRTIQAWATDDSVSLMGLPTLTDDSMPGAAYERLITHLSDALESVADSWVAALSKVIGSLGDPHALAVDLVSLRRKLARRLELARHPSLPPILRDAFSDAVDRSVRQSQKQLEQAIVQLGRSGRAAQPVVDELHRVVRENSFVAVLSYTADQAGGRFTPNHRVAEPTGLSNSVPERTRRRIIQ